MKTRTITLFAAFCCFCIFTSAQVSSELKTKFVVQAIATERIESDAPVLMVYPEGEDFEILQESGAIPTLEKSITRLGYSLVKSEMDAAVFIRVSFVRDTPYTTDIEYKNRPTLDYSNSASTANYAAMLGGGRYKELANPSKNRNQNNAAAILGPTGEIINLADREDRATKIVESEEQSLQATIYPISFEVSAWMFDQDKKGDAPQQLWAVRASYNNLRDEDTQPQLTDLSKTASRYFGKNLKKEKLVTRK